MDWRRVIRPRTLFVLATIMGCSSTFMAWRLAALEPKTAATIEHGRFARLAVINLAYWYVPALVALPILAFAFHLIRTRRPAAVVIAAHLVGLLIYAGVHGIAMTAVRALVNQKPFAGGLMRAMQSDFYTQFDWRMMTYGALVGVAYAASYRRDAERRAASEAELRVRLVEAQLTALRHQLQPHFLFNTLNTVAALMRTNVDAADDVLDQLGDLLRMTLRSDGRQEVPLRGELEILHKYLQIEQARFGGRLTVAVTPAPDTIDALVPTLLLQPIVENAIRHGIAPHGRAGRIEIAASRAGDRLTIDVRDTGGGVPDGPLPSGVGLTNTRQRLERLYGSSQSLVVANRRQGGCQVTVTLPFRRDDAAGEPTPQSHVA